MTALPIDQSPDGDIQPYAAAYLAAHPDRVFAGWQFIVWMNTQWADWAAETGTDLSRSLSAVQHEAFGVWLAERWTA